MQIHSITRHFTERAGHETCRVTLLYCGFVRVCVFLLAFPATSESVWSLHPCCEIESLPLIPHFPHTHTLLCLSEKSFHSSLDLCLTPYLSLSLSHLSLFLSHTLSHPLCLSHSVFLNIYIYIYIYVYLSMSVSLTLSLHSLLFYWVYSFSEWLEYQQHQTHKALQYVLKFMESDGFNLARIKCFSPLHFMYFLYCQYSL